MNLENINQLRESFSIDNLYTHLLILADAYEECANTIPSEPDAIIEHYYRRRAKIFRWLVASKIKVDVDVSTEYVGNHADMTFYVIRTSVSVQLTPWSTREQKKLKYSFTSKVSDYYDVESATNKRVLQIIENIHNSLSIGTIQEVVA